MEGFSQASSSALTFYAAWFCPFAQRAWMALLHKGIAFEYIEVDPYRESAWWKETSRGRAKVPVIISPGDVSSGQTTVIDSTRVLEYLEDLDADKAPLYPDSPDEKAEQRFWIDHINERIVPYMYRVLKARRPGKYRDESKASLIDGMHELVEAMAPSVGFFNGEQLTAVDLALIPFAYRIDVLLGHYREFTLPMEGKTWRRYKSWYDTLLQTPAFRASATDHPDYRERLIDFYLPYSLGEGQKDVTAVNH